MAHLTYRDISLIEWTSECGGDLEVTSAGINYPDSGTYRKYLNCVWTVNRTGEFLLRFARFDVEKSRACRYDWLQVDDGKKICGKTLPKDIIIKKSSVRIKFHSDGYNYNKGFKINVHGKHIKPFFTFS